MDRKDKAQVRDISKKIKQCIRDNKRSNRHEKNYWLFLKSKDYEGRKHQDKKKGVLITHMINKLGSIEATRKGIANVFAEFYEDQNSRQNVERQDKQSSEAGLDNTCDHPDDDIENDEHDRHILEFTRTELTAEIDSLKKGKSADSRSKQKRSKADEKTITLMHELFKLTIKPNPMKKAVITVIYKKGDGTNTEI